MAISPAVGMVFGRFPAARVPFAVGVCLVTVAGWVTLLACFGGRPPHALIIAVAALMAAGVPASTIGFSLARDYNGRTVVGTAAVRWWLRVRGLLLGAQSRGEPVPVRVVERPFDRTAGHNAVRVSSREGRGAVSAARRVG
jgi:hypothetical protein